jgi:flavin reductase
MVDQKIFRDGMARLGAAVTVVTTDGPAGRRGLTVSAVCSVTDAPPSLMVCINQRSGSHDVITANGVLCVNVLAGRHEGLSEAFGGRADPGLDRFGGVSWTTLVTGAPVLADAAAAFDCRIKLARSIGTHSAILCEVQAMTVSDTAEGLIYFNRALHHLTAARAT